MSVKRRDPLTGHQTTGHEWNGITELNTRVPRAVWFFIIVTHVWAVVVWILLPTWPLVTTYTKGILGLDQREEVAEDIASAALGRADWVEQVATRPVAEILEDSALMAYVTDTANQLFGDNCAGCHGADAAGGPGFPSLVDEAWLWGRDAQTLSDTLRVGINATHPDTRYAQMLGFGREGILSRDEVRNVVGYVKTLSGLEAPSNRLHDGVRIFDENCASCHGANATGNTDLGAPDLTDDFWIYGSDDEDMFRTVWDGRQGWMPAWEHRLSETDRKLLVVYLQELNQEAAQ